MQQNLLIVESPAKAKTIAGYLRELPGAWQVIATRGHLVDLPKNRLGIERQQGHYIPQWQVLNKKSEIIGHIKKVAATAHQVYIASDDDREGEKIAHDIIHRAGIKHPIRITFTEITPRAIQRAIKSGSRPLATQKVDAQIARRLADREIGYPLSSIIRWHFQQQNPPSLPKGIGRVISPALYLIHQNHQAIETFVPEQYRRIVVDYMHNHMQFRLSSDNKFFEDHTAEMESLLKHLHDYPHLVYAYQRKTRDIPPFPPLITSRLQRCAFYLFGFNPDYTMQLAQQLYEGVNTACGLQGLITYPRTDSYTLSDDAAASIITLLTDLYEDNYTLSSKRVFPNKSTAQGAHEAIRPAHFEPDYYPKALKKYLSEDQFKLYELIWYRTLATQMTNAVYDVSIIEVDVNGHRLKGEAFFRLFDGWERLDGHRANNSERDEDERYKFKEKRIPEVLLGHPITPVDIKPVEISTRQPARYGIGRFITLLDNRGIARPSTLDTIIPSLMKKGYIKIHQGMLYMTDLGNQVDNWVNEYTPWLSDIDHARAFEEHLDQVETGQQQLDSLLDQYVDRIEILKKSLEYQEPSSIPTQNQIDYAKRLASEKGLSLDDDILENRADVSRFIDKNSSKKPTLGKCPHCGIGQVTVHEQLFACSKRECDFKVWRSNTERFIEQFNVPVDSPGDLIKSLLKRKQTHFEKLSSKKSGKVFAANIALEYSEQYKNWSPTLVFE